jgi:MFS transporter, ACS family, D-galactonate transporter
MLASRRYPWLVVGLLWVVAVLNYLDRQMLATMRPAMIGDFEELRSASQYGYLLSIFLWIYAFMSPVAGWIADKTNKKWIIICSLLVWSFVTSSMAFASQYNQLYWLRAAMGLSEAFYIPAALALIADYHRAGSRSLAIGIHLSGVYMGQALGGLGAVISADYSWQSCFRFFGWIGIAYSILLIFLLKNPSQPKDPLPKPNQDNPWAAFRYLLIQFPFWLILLYFMVPSLPGWIIKNWLPTLFSEKTGIPMVQAGPWTTVIVAGASFVGVIGGGYLADRWIQKDLRGRIHTSVLGLLLTVPALIGIAFGQTATFYLLGGFCFGLGFGIFDANNMPILSQFVPARCRATAYGCMNLVGISAGALSTSVLGRSLEAGSVSGLIILLVVMILFVLILVWWYLQPRVKDYVE